MGWLDRLKRKPQSPSGNAARAGDFRGQLEVAGLSEWADRLVALDRPSVRLEARPSADPDEIAIGLSRLGGEPDLPEGVPWPEWQGRPLSFLAQIALGEMPEIADSDLPMEGILYFFYEADQGAWGFRPGDRGAWRILFAEPDAPLSRRPTPSGVHKRARFRPVRLIGRAEVTHVGHDSDELESLGMSPNEQLAYVEHTEIDVSHIHRLLGHPETIQGDMALECQLVSHGLDCGDESGYESPRAVELAPGAVQWKLLLQIDSDPAARMQWGDGGRLYFWMTGDAMRRRDWDSAWMVLQCY
jgi:uncharacterized protein YwqG